MPDLRPAGLSGIQSLFKTGNQYETDKRNCNSLCCQPRYNCKAEPGLFCQLKRSDRGEKDSASSHFIIGLEGEIVQEIPIYEVAYATSKEKNKDTVSIECCHPDETGKFNDQTYASW